jgi:hypothetical protein
MAPPKAAVGTLRVLLQLEVTWGVLGDRARGLGDGDRLLLDGLRDLNWVGLLPAAAPSLGSMTAGGGSSSIGALEAVEEDLEKGCDIEAAAEAKAVENLSMADGELLSLTLNCRAKKEPRLVICDLRGRRSSSSSARSCSRSSPLEALSSGGSWEETDEGPIIVMPSIYYSLS